MIHDRRDAAMRLALELARRRPMERRAVRFVWTVEGRVRRMAVVRGGRRCECSRTRTVAHTKAVTPGREG